MTLRVIFSQNYCLLGRFQSQLRAMGHRCLSRHLSANSDPYTHFLDRVSQSWQAVTEAICSFPDSRRADLRLALIFKDSLMEEADSVVKCAI